MGVEDYRKDVARTDLPGDLGGDETAWLEGWDAAQREDEAKKQQTPTEMPITMSQTDGAGKCP